MPLARRNQRRGPSGPSPRINPGSVTATTSGNSVTVQGVMTTTEPVTFDGLNISIARDQDPSFPWVASTAISNGQTVNGTRTLSGTASSLADGNYVAYVSYSLDGQSTWTTGPKVRFTIGAVVTPVVPNAPEAYVLSATPSSLAFGWKIPTEPGGTIISYIVTVLDPSGQPLPGYPQTLNDVNARSHEVSGLPPTTSYTFKVSARNTVGDSPDSTPVSQATTGITGGGTGTPSAPAITVTGTSTSTVAISWIPPTQPNGTVTNYRIGWEAPGGLPVPEWNGLWSSSTSSLTLTNLAADSIYNVWVEAINENGTGERYTVVQRTVGVGGGSGGDPGGNHSNLPMKMVGLYAAMWSNSPGYISRTPPAVNVLYYSFGIRGNGSNGYGSLDSVGYGREGRAVMDSVYNAVRGRGGKIIFSLGGSGQIDPMYLGDTSYLVNRIIQIGADLGGIDGIDFDLEKPLTNDRSSAQHHVALCQGLKAHFGNQFIVTIAPGGGNTSLYYPVAGALYAAGCMDMVGHQYYEGAENWSEQVTINTIRSKINSTKGYGIPNSNIGIGMMTPEGGSFDPWDYHTVPEWTDLMQQVYNEFGIAKCYLWEVSDPNLSYWANSMRSVFGY